MAKSFSIKSISWLSVCLLIILQVNHVNTTEIECGTAHFDRPLIAYGKPTQRGEWPFLAALFKFNGHEFFCGGSLISDRHVLTAAHCINEKGSSSSRLPSDIFVLLGAYDLTLGNDTSVLPRNVSKIYVHPDWNVYSQKYDADVAILRLNETVRFTNYIRWVCMPPDNFVTDGARGSVVGWGLNENATNNLKFIKRANVTVLRASYCYTEDYIVASISSIRTFCGQGEDASPNQGDSGGGFYVLFGSAWVQYGIVSSLRKYAADFINANAVSVYTNVIEFKSWIVETVTDTGSAVADAKVISDIKIHLNCFYSYDNEDSSYGCWLFDLDLQVANIAVDSITGVHHYLNSDQNVSDLIFVNGTMFFLPSDIGKVFKNLTSLQINDGLRIQSIRRSNLKNLGNLLNLWIDKNDIVTLDRYALWDLPNLEDFRLQENHLKEIDGRTFENNLKLREISLNSNHLEVLPINLFQHNSLLEIVTLDHNFLKVIDQRAFETNRQLSEVWLHSNQFETLPKNLFQNNSLLMVVTLHENLLNVMDGKIFEENPILSGGVDLSSNRLKVLPWDLFQSNSLLEFVRLYNNSLKLIDEKTFSTINKLRNVDLSSNQLETLPWNLYKENTLLEVVFLQHNSLKVIDCRIFETNIKLKKVALFSNQLQFLPWNLFLHNSLIEILGLQENLLNVIDERIFEKNTLLREVHLSSNQFQVLPWNLFLHNSLIEIVSLQENFLKIIDERIFLTIEKLKVLELNSNQLETIPTSLLKNNLLLESVSLFNNSLKIINEETFDKNWNLRNLYLHSNQLEIIPRHLLKNNVLLEIISFRQNLLKSIDERIFETNMKLLRVDLGMNRLEIVPKNLFKNNLLIEFVELGSNLIKIIEIDFTDFSHIKRIYFYDNICINAYYDVVDPNRYFNEFNNLTEFLGFISANCSPK